jgi:hypothetical protein
MVCVINAAGGCQRRMEAIRGCCVSAFQVIADRHMNAAKACAVADVQRDILLCSLESRISWRTVAAFLLEEAGFS